MSSRLQPQSLSLDWRPWGAGYTLTPVIVLPMAMGQALAILDLGSASGSLCVRPLIQTSLLVGTPAMLANSTPN